VNFTVVGAFVLAMTTLLIAGVLWLAAGGASRSPEDLYQAIEDESVAGLNLNAPVKYNGVDVGRVRSIALDPTNPNRVRLVLAIKRGTPIKVDTLAILKTQGLTGIAYVELTGGARDAATLLASVDGELPQIRTKPSLSAQLENVLTRVLTQLDSTSNNLNALLSDANKAAFSQTLANSAQVSQTLAELLAKNRGALDRTLANSALAAERGAQASAQIGPVLDRIGRGADAVERLGSSAALASDNAGKAVVTAAGDLQRLTAEALPDLQRLTGDLVLLSGSLRRLAEQAERSPSSLLLGRSPVPAGPGESSPGEAPR
jgi:phospholipid/cholesterol/gamma-HCH transport system substrate-binding protein